MKMKHIKITLMAASFAFLSLMACKKILDQSPQDKFTDQAVWSDMSLAQAYLSDIYRTAQPGFTKINGDGKNEDWASLIAMSDNAMVFSGAAYYETGNIFQNQTDINNWTRDFQSIQKINVFLDNVDNVINSAPSDSRSIVEAQVKTMKAEATFLRAFVYTELVTQYGGVPLFNTANKLGVDYLNMGRNTFEESINFIVKDCDAAAVDLKAKSAVDEGRVNKGAALALKSRVLLFAASDLTADGSAVNEFVGYKSPNRTQLWTSAKEAAKAVMNLGTFQLEDFSNGGIATNQEVSDGYYSFFSKQSHAGDKSVIWNVVYNSSDHPAVYSNHELANGYGAFVNNNPTQALVDSYQMIDGSDFLDNFSISSSGVYSKKAGSAVATDNIYEKRDPRLTGTILYDGAKFMQRFSDNVRAMDPVGQLSIRTIATINSAGDTTFIYGIDTQRGGINEANASPTGYAPRKYVQDDRNPGLVRNDNSFIEFRYAEILLNYAEACIELGDPDGSGVQALNQIRKSRNMPPIASGADLKKAAKYERRVELGFEGRRFDDMRRYKTLNQTFVDKYGINIIQVIDNVNHTNKTTWQRLKAESVSFDPKVYWLPIPQNEMDKAQGFGGKNNPGY